MNIIGTATEAFSRFVGEWNAPGDSVLAHTSGSTGKPKDIWLRKSDMRQSAAYTCRFLNIGDRPSVMALSLSPDYIAGKMMVVRAMECGSTLYVEPPSMYPLKEYPDEQPIDLMAIVPSQVDGLLQSGKAQLVRNLLIGGAPLSVEAERSLVDCGINAFVTYGMTETCSHIALRRVGTPYYKVFDGIKISTDRRNCLVIECDYLSCGEIVTNDVVKIINPTMFEWLGRNDNVINSGGIKFYPEQIEKKISSLLPDYEFYITGAKSEKWGEEIVLVVESEKEIPDLENKIADLVDRFERPKRIIYKSVLDRTYSGKIIRNKTI